MRIGGFRLQFIGHACFLITTPGGASVVTDPLFSTSYTEGKHGEKVVAYLTPPKVAAADIRRCDAVFSSHIHGDHFDPPAIRTITGLTGAQVWAAPEMTDLLRRSGFPDRFLAPLTEGRTFTVKDLTATALAGYDDSRDAQGRANKFSLLLEAGGTRILYCGDAHHAPAALVGQEVDAVISWPLPNEQECRQFHRDLRTKRYVLMHGDWFFPRETFWCAFSYAEQKARMERLLKPDYPIVIPKPVKRLAPARARPRP